MSGDGLASRRASASTRRLAIVTAVTLTLLLGAAIGLGWAAEGSDGALSAGLGVALTGVLFGGGLMSLHRTAAGSGSFGPVAAAFALRIVLYAAALALITRAQWLHGPSLAAATAASIAVMLAVELIVLAREPLAELEPRERIENGPQDDTSR
jgi:hypothetical protein